MQAFLLMYLLNCLIGGPWTVWGAPEGVQGLQKYKENCSKNTFLKNSNATICNITMEKSSFLQILIKVTVTCFWCFITIFSQILIFYYYYYYYYAIDHQTLRVGYTYHTSSLYFYLLSNIQQHLKRGNIDQNRLSISKKISSGKIAKCYLNLIGLQGFPTLQN